MATDRRRSTYHHGDLRNALLTAAVEVAERSGPEAVTIRSVARKVGVTPTAAYRHFSGHDELLDAIKDEAVASLGKAMLHSLGECVATGDQVPDAVSRLVAMGHGYIRFAVSEPGLFRTAFVRRAGMPPQENIERPDDPYGLLCRGLDELVDVGYLAEEHRPLAEFAAWAAVHGMATLLIGGLDSALPDDVREQAIDRTFELLMRGMGTGPAAAPLRSTVDVE